MIVVSVLLAIALLVAANALYVAAEFAAVSARRSRIRSLAEEQRNRLAQRLLPHIGDRQALDRYIAACQVGITLTSLVLGAYGEATIAPVMAELLGELGGWERAAAHSAASIVVLVALSVLQMVLGELVPKGLALQFPERTALATVLPMAWSVRVLRPLIWVFNGSGLALLRLIGVRYTAHRHVHTPGEIDLMLAEGGDTGAIDPEGRRRLRRALRLVSRRARDFMVPRQRIAGIEVDTPFAQAARQIAETPYTRLLVYRGQLDQVVGSVHTKDVVLAQMAERAVALRELMGPVATVTPGATADQVLAQLRERRTQQAVVVDARRRVVGLVTLSDVLGEVFGSMADEVKVKGGARRARVRRETGRPG